MRLSGLLALVVVVLACGPSPNAKLPPEYTQSVGGATSGGAGGSSNATGGSAVVGSGGSSVRGSGGAASGGRGVGTGGARDGTGGQRRGTGGRAVGTGGRSLVTDGGAGRDGRGDGLIRGVGGRGEGTGGRAGGSGGTASGSDARSGDAPAASCYSEIINNGYACGSAAPCSACKVNDVSKEAECQKGVDCLAAAGPSCDSNCQLKCLNEAGDAQVGACIKALQTAACGGAGC